MGVKRMLSAGQNEAGGKEECGGVINAASFIAIDRAISAPVIPDSARVNSGIVTVGFISLPDLAKFNSSKRTPFLSMRNRTVSRLHGTEITFCDPAS